MKGRASFCDSCDRGLDLDLDLDVDLDWDLDVDLDLDLGFGLGGSLDAMECITSSCLWCFAIWTVALFLFVLG